MQQPTTRYDVEAVYTNGSAHRNGTHTDGAPTAIVVQESAGPPLIQVTDLRKEYQMGDTVVRALRGVTLDVGRGELVAVMGPSGSGKSTFMNVVGCLDQPTSGSYRLNGVEVASMNPNALADVRGRELGFVFQSFHLLPKMDALSNVMLPMLYGGVPANVRRARALAALRAVGLGERYHHLPKEMSGGQQQRTAIARALANNPSVILADEPTGALDSRTSVEIMAILQRLNRRGATIVIVTHEPDIARHCSRVVVFKDGAVLNDQRVAEPVSADEVLAQMPTAEDAA
jgi:putative ABC transport system ATP-binding protein